ncbi:MAG: phytoene desaturase [Actinobacteria bacterium]|nr:phytoene desaturase [Actinomycetota bacterium]
MSRVVVVGAGVGGLAAAARLRVKGHDVTVYEQASRVGGKLATYRRDGFAFDTGPSLFTLPAVYRDLFLKTGAPLEDEVDLQPLDPAFGYHFADGSTAVLPGVDPARCAAALGDQLGGSTQQEWLSFMDRASDMWQLTRRPFLESPLDGWRTLLPLAKPRDVRTVAPFTSLRSLSHEYFHDPRLVTLVDRYATYTGSDPRKAPAVLATVPYVEQAFGAWHLGGGVGTLGEALQRRCASLGVDIHVDSSVQRITTRGGAVTGLDLGGTHVSANVVIANADAGIVYGSLVDDPVAKKERARVDNATPSLAGFVILLALRGKSTNLQHHNVWFPSNYDDEFDSIFGSAPRPVPDPAIYVCAPDDPAMAPTDHEAWFVLVNAPRHGPGGVDWTAPGLAEGYADHVLDVLAQRGMDVRERILWREVRTPADLEASVRAPGGSIYGQSSNGARAAFSRPANRSPVSGLFLVSGSAHPGGGLPLVGMGADIVAGLVGRA